MNDQNFIILYFIVVALICGVVSFIAGAEWRSTKVLQTIQKSRECKASDSNIVTLLEIQLGEYK